MDKEIKILNFRDASSDVEKVFDITDFIEFTSHGPISSTAFEAADELTMIQARKLNELIDHDKAYVLVTLNESTLGGYTNSIYIVKKAEAIKIEIEEMLSATDDCSISCDDIMSNGFTRVGITEDINTLKELIHCSSEIDYQCTVLLSASLHELTGLRFGALGSDESLDYISASGDVILRLYEYDYNQAAAVVYTVNKEV